MKQALIVLIAAIACTQIAIGQSTFGIKGGVNLSYQTEQVAASFYFPKSIANSKPLAGYNAGVFYKRKLNKLWTLSAELNLNVIGSKLSYIHLNPSDSSYTDGEYNASIGYVEVPLFAEYTINRFYVGAGPSFSYKVFNKKLSIISNLDYKTTDVAANVLAGYRLGKKLDINVRYSYGLPSIINPQFYNNTTLKNRFTNVSLLYSLK